MAVHRRREELKRRREAVGLTQEKLAAVLGVDRSTVARWEWGRSTPQPWIRRRLASALLVTIDDLEALLHPVLADPTPVFAAGTLAAGDWEEFDEVLRRRFLASTASTLTSLGVQIPAEAMGRPAGAGRRIGASDVASVRSMTKVLGDAASEFGGGHLLTPTLQYVTGNVQHMLDGQPGAHGRDLDAAASEITQLAAWMAQDGGDFDQAAQLYWKAHDLGCDARDPELAATALRGLSSMAGEQHDFAEAVRLAEMAVDAAGGLDHPKARAYYYCSLATASSLDGDRALALSSLELSRMQIEHAQTEPGSSWASHYSPGRWAHEAGQILARAGEMDAAAEHMRRSLEIYGLDRKRTRAMVLADLGTAQLKQGAVDAAVKTWREFLTCADGVSSTRIDKATREMVARLARVGGTDAEQLRQDARVALRASG
ncbi:helix-turn-helix transcriptional regulator [Catenulispora yoronensis]